MCEPTNSIIQYPSNDDQGVPTEQRLGLFGKACDWVKRVADWLHFSKMGSGHHEAIRKTGSFSGWIPEETRYEARWWDRTVRLDGRYNGAEFDAGEALKAATTYADAVSIGSLTSLRRFLETSLRKSDMPQLYVTMFAEQLLNKGGRDEFLDRLRKLLNRKNNLLSWELGNMVKGPMQESIIRTMMGFTRKRELLVPAWADDSSLWVPKPKVLPVS